MKTTNNVIRSFAPSSKDVGTCLQVAELTRCRGDCVIDGFSSVGGQTRSPYIYGDIVLDEGDLSPSVCHSSA